MSLSAWFIRLALRSLWSWIKEKIEKFLGIGEKKEDEVKGPQDPEDDPNYWR